jgi:hypothetical protein
MKKTLIAFSLLFLLALSFGCIGENNNAKNQTTAGALNATVLVNGVETNKMSLVSGQNAQVGVKLLNNADVPLKNVKGRLISCLGVYDSKTNDIPPKSEAYMSWNVKAPSMGESEVITCPTTIRICFETTTKGYTDLVFIPENYTDVPPVAHSTSQGSFLMFIYKFGVARVIGNSENEISGNIYLRNTGNGWVDYITYPENSGLGLNVIKNMTITLEGDNIEIQKFGSLNQTELLDKEWLSSDKKTITITSGDVEGGYSYLLKLIQGKELFQKLTIGITNPKEFQDSTHIYRLKTEANYGYCINVAEIDTTISGR